MLKVSLRARQAPDAMIRWTTFYLLLLILGTQTPANTHCSPRCPGNDVHCSHEHDQGLKQCWTLFDSVRRRPRSPRSCHHPPQVSGHRGRMKPLRNVLGATHDLVTKSIILKEPLQRRG